MAAGISAILFDLDDTLMVEMASEAEAFLAACGLARERFGVDAETLHRAVRARARELWRGFEAFPYCERIGFASWEGLWARYEGPGPEMARLRAWAPTYQHEAWARGLADVGIGDGEFADVLSGRYQEERWQRHVVFDETVSALEDLQGDFRLAILTNGAREVQESKIAGSGLGGYFDAIVISGAVGAGKPGRRVFEITLDRLGVSAAAAAMVGNSLSSDVQGALHAGVMAVWLNRDGSWAEEGITPDVEISLLTELRGALARPG